MQWRSGNSERSSVGEFLLGHVDCCVIDFSLYDFSIQRPIKPEGKSRRRHQRHHHNDNSEDEEDGTSSGCSSKNSDAKSSSLSIAASIFFKNPEEREELTMSVIA